MGRKDIDIAIKPGGMLSDVVENKLGKMERPPSMTSHHDEVINLRQDKLGEWECVKGYIDGKTGFSDLTNGIEVTEDRTSERFLLLQDGITLKRIDYDIAASPLTGYENESVTTLSLPSGVTIGASAKLRFFYYRGVVRITGCSSPMWYGYISRTLFEERSGGDDVTIAGWFLTKSGLYGGVVSFDLLNINFEDFITDSTHTIHIKHFLIYDDSQYTLHTLFEGQSEDTVTEVAKGQAIDITIPHTLNERVTGIGIAVARLNKDGSEIDKVWYVADVLPFNFANDVLFSLYTYVHEELKYNSGTTQKLIVDKNVDVLPGPISVGSLFHWQDTTFQVGDILHLTNDNGSVSDATIVSIDNYDIGQLQMEINLDKAITDLTTDGTTQDLADTTIRIERKWLYDASGWKRKFAFSQTMSLVNIFDAFTEIPAGTLDITPNFSHHVIIEERPFCKSEEDEEEDVVRYGPLNQFDNFPNGYIIQTQVGDIDRNKAIAKRGDRLMILKNKSTSQISFVGSRYREDIGLKDNGILGADFFYVVGTVIYFGDKEDVYIYAGAGDPVPLLAGQLMRNYYRKYVNSSSLIFYRKLDNELWIILSGGRIMVYHFDRKEWYIRSTDIVSLFAFLDHDKNMYVGSSTKLVTFDHSQTTYGESINYSFRTMIFDLTTPQFDKKVRELMMAVQSNNNILVTINDDGKAASYSDSITPSSTIVKAERLKPQYRFKKMDIYVTGVAANNLTATIRDLNLKVMRWK